MGPFATGQVVLVNYPYSDLSGSKIRPAVVVGRTGRGDWIVCQITSNPFADAGSVQLDSEQFATGGLQRRSFARPDKVVTLNVSIFQSVAGTLLPSVLESIRVAIIRTICRD